MKEKNGIIKGATFLGIGAFVSKLLGAIYRVPLTALVGAKGLGLYQMVFPVYSLLLDFSGAGLPSALSKLISATDKNKHQTAYTYLRVSLTVFFCIGLFFSIITALFSFRIARFQGDENARLAYLCLSPSIALVTLISCFRGYFQGLMDMKPTAFSQIIEQSVKLIFGLALAYIYRENVISAVAGATGAITISELVALLFLYVKYKNYTRKHGLNFTFNSRLFKDSARLIIKTTIPVTLIGIMIPFSHVIDSFLIINLLSAYRSDATALFGLLSGVVTTIINLPVSVCYGIATVAIPAISGAKNKAQEKESVNRTIGLTLAISVPCALGLLLFAPNVIGLLFSRLTALEKQTAINLLRICSISVILMSILQTTNALLIGKGKLYKPVFSLSVGVAIKTILNFTLIKNPKINVYGGAIGLIACYFVVCLINLIMILKKGVANESKRVNVREYAS